MNPRTLITLVAAALVTTGAFAQHPLNKNLTNRESTFSELNDMEVHINEFMRRSELKGLSISVMRNDSLLFSKGFGIEDNGREMRPGTIMRVASVSKLLTAAGIMLLQDMGMLEIKDRVFGPDGIIDEFDSVITDHDIYAITVENLLRHEGGFDEGLCDPMFSSLQMKELYHLDRVPGPTDIARCVLSESLAFYPGTSQSYSNFGYYLLSLVIEKVTGQKYEGWMQKNLLHPAGCYDMHIAGNYYEDRYPGEARYYMPAGSRETREYNDSKRMVERCYGGNDITGLSGAGAWVASTPELARFVASIDGIPGVKDIISNESVMEMTCYFDRNTYSLGWLDTNPENGWIRTGTLAATHALIKYYPDGECWIVLTNSGHYRGARFSSSGLGYLCDSCHEEYSYLLPSRNLF